MLDKQIPLSLILYEGEQSQFYLSPIPPFLQGTSEALPLWSHNKLVEKVRPTDYCLPRPTQQAEIWTWALLLQASPFAVYHVGFGNIQLLSSVITENAKNG